MEEYIKKSAARHAVLHNEGQAAVAAIEAIKPEDVVPVVHGYNKQFKFPSQFTCSVCGWESWDTYCGDTDTYNYCPNCGAKMEEGKRQ